MKHNNVTTPPHLMISFRHLSDPAALAKMVETWSSTKMEKSGLDLTAEMILAIVRCRLNSSIAEDSKKVRFDKVATRSRKPSS